MRNTVAVTGHNGYIGSVLCSLLHKEGYEVFGFDRNMATPSPHVSVATNDLPTLIRYIDSFGINKIFHLAAKSVPIDESMTHPIRYYHNNAGLTSSLLNQLIESGWKGDIVFASSAAVYYPEKYSLHEDSNKLPISHYGLSKLMCEKIFEAAAVNDIRTVAMRFFNVTGAAGTIGDNNPHVLSELCKAAKTGSKFNLNGIHHSTPDGTCVRDYVHVIDVCRAMIVAMRDMEINRDLVVPKQHTLKEEKFNAYNLGSKIGTSILELIGLVKEISGKTIDYKVCPARAGDPSYLVADPTKFMMDYGFEYKHGDIKTIVQSAWEYHNGV